MNNVPKRRKLQLIGILSLIAVICLSLIGGTYRRLQPSDANLIVDSLNDRAYLLRYTEHDSVISLTHKAINLSHDYKTGKTIALNHRLFQASLDIDYTEAEALYEEIQQTTKNRIELLISNVSMMMICQRTGQHLLFFDYQQQALQHITRIEEESNLSEHQTMRYFYALNEYRLTNTIHMLQTGSVRYAEQELDRISVSEELRQDKTLWTHYHYIKGLISLNKGNADTSCIIDAFDYFFQAYTVAVRYDQRYFIGSIEQVFAEMLTHSNIDSLIRVHRNNESHYLYQFFTHHDSIDHADMRHLHVAKGMAQSSIKNAQSFDNIILEANGLLALGDAYFYNGEREASLPYYIEALECLNRHHTTFYPKSDSTRLLTYADDMTEYVDTEWITDTQVQTSPATLLHIREALSRAYSAMAADEQALYNRNIYLNLVQYTRESRYIDSRINQSLDQNRILRTILYVFTLFVLASIGILTYQTRRWRRKNKRETKMLSIISEWFIKTSDTEDTTELNDALTSIQQQHIEKSTIDNVVTPFYTWKKNMLNETHYSESEITSLMDDFNKSTYQIANNKRDNIQKRAKVSLTHAVRPFIDRILYVVRKAVQVQGITPSQLSYIRELADQIDLYNDVLSEWVKINSGKIDLTIERFKVQELFDMIQKSAFTYERKGLHLIIHPTASAVKADKALTLFMINTLAENARKFTPSGGNINICADEKDDYVEISVTDNGVGLTSEEREMILSSKIYDAQQIGADHEHIKKEKGSGFGLLNCKGIIEKYKKTNELFNVCRFDIESEKGKGSRFSFRLPKAIISLLTICWLTITTLIPDNLYANNSSNDTLLKMAREMADSSYSANSNKQYETAIHYGDSAFHLLNRYYSAHTNGFTVQQPLCLLGTGNEESEWWKADINADYPLIRKLRISIATAALQQCDWKLYEYNNRQHIILNDLLSRDASLIDTYHELEEKQQQLRIYATLLILLLISTILFFYILFLRKNISHSTHVAKILEMYTSMLHSTEGEDILRQTLHIIYHGINEIHGVTDVKILLQKSNTREIMNCGTATNNIPDDLLIRSFERDTKEYDANHHIQVYPLTVKTSNIRRCFGAIAFRYTREEIETNELVFDKYIANFTAIMLYDAILRREHTTTELGIIEDNKQRALFEENRLHVQNMILDNCLSTIKHESLYYPGRIKQITSSIATEKDVSTKAEKLSTLAELVEYYQYIYTLFCRQADKQIDSGLYQCIPIAADAIRSQWLDTTLRFIRKHQLATQTHINSGQLTVYAEPTLLQMMLETITREWMKNDIESLSLHIDHEGGDFIKITLHTPAQVYDTESTENLFQPDKKQYALLLCKEIIREHDKLNDFCGCRINIESNLETGTLLWFTLPKNK